MRRLIAGNLPPDLWLVAFNGKSSGGYSIGVGTSSNKGSSWETEGFPRVVSEASWEAGGVKDARIFWDPTDKQYVMLYAGYTQDTSQHFQIGRAVASPFRSTWTKDSANPVLAFGSSGDADFGGACFPAVYLDGTTLRLWYTGFAATNGASTGVGTVCYAESTDYGKTFTRHGTVIGAGAGGSFNSTGTYMGGVYKSGSTFYVYVGGFNGTVFRSAYSSTTTPATAASYSSLTQLSNYASNFTIGGKTWQDNQPRDILPDGSGGYIAFVDLWNPTDTSTILETCSQVTSPDLTSWASPSSLMLPFDGWSTVSAENPSVLAAA